MYSVEGAGGQRLVWVGGGEPTPRIAPGSLVLHLGSLARCARRLRRGRPLIQAPHRHLGLGQPAHASEKIISLQAGPAQPQECTDSAARWMAAGAVGTERACMPSMRLNSLLSSTDCTFTFMVGGAPVWLHNVVPTVAPPR